MSYAKIEDHGIVGNLRTSALISLDGTIDWLCFPRFDSPSVFASILDDSKGGHFRVSPISSGEVTHKQFYLPETNVLITRFLSADGVGQITDFMPVATDGEKVPSLVRQIHAVRGRVTFDVDCQPAFDYARTVHETRIENDVAYFSTEKHELILSTNVPLEMRGSGVGARLQLSEGQTSVLTLGDGDTEQISSVQADVLFRDTVDYWRHWISGCTYAGRWREQVYRSALTLKLLTCEETGAIVAAPTSSLPEDMGGERNWDYRYTWIRDAAFTLYGLLRIGFTDEAAKFMEWLEGRCRELDEDGSLGIMYSLDGRSELTEETLEHLDGYRGSRPVRVGNGAHGQLQLDIYGALMDSVYLFNKYGRPISHDLWTKLRGLVDWVCDNWQREDESIWEVRGGRRHFLYSKLMCWVAVDRALRLADKRSFPADRTRWLKVRDEIYEQIMELGWNEDKQAFVQSYGSESLDAAALIMPLVFFLSPTDPRALATLDAINRAPKDGGLVEDGLVYRYDPEVTDDGLSGGEGSFNMCSFWLVEALTRAGQADPKRLEAARLTFEQMLGYANHLGLYAEETGPHGEALGNFPQAFTHLALISAAFNLDRALGTRAG
ncbi:MAG: glycoside hydrolase family 15 protein [bacterium]|nr:glycoside hydrolase family 15 protein [bacterium]MCP5069173.1 glycoside hydrolase family 15 protein [bacterium]